MQKWRDHLLKQANRIFALHQKYVLGSITFEDYGFELSRGIVHKHDDETFSVSISVNGLFSDGSVQINSDGRIELTIVSNPKKSALLATQATDKFLAELEKRLAKEKKTNAFQKIMLLKNQIKELKAK